MAKGIYIGVDGKARKVKKAYIGVDGKARKIKKGYIGIDGVARLFYSAEQVLSRYGTSSNLSSSKYGAAGASNGEYALFAGGETYSGGYNSAVDAYSKTLVKSSATNLTWKVRYLAGAGIGEYALYPADATYSNGTLTATLSATTPVSSTGSCSIMAGVINEKNEVEFKQFTAYVSLQLSKVPTIAKSIVISSDKNLSGEFSVALPEAFETGIAAVAGDKTVTINLE